MKIQTKLLMILLAFGVAPSANTDTAYNRMLDVTAHRSENPKNTQAKNNVLKKMLNNVESTINNLIQERDKAIKNLESLIKNYETMVNANKPFEEITNQNQKIEETSLAIDEQAEELDKLCKNLNKKPYDTTTYEAQKKQLEKLFSKIAELSQKIVKPQDKAALFTAMKSTYTLASAQLTGQKDHTTANKWFENQFQKAQNRFNPDKQANYKDATLSDQIKNTFKQIQYIIDVLSDNKNAKTSLYALDKEFKTNFAKSMRYINEKSQGKFKNLLREILKNYKNCYPAKK